MTNLSIVPVSVLFTLILQVTLLCAFAFVAMKLFGSSSARRYGIAYTSLLAVALLSITSFFLQTSDIRLLTVELDLAPGSIASLEGLVPLSASEPVGQFSVAPPPVSDLDLNPALFAMSEGGLQLSMQGIISAIPALVILIWMAGIGLSWLKIVAAAVRLRVLVYRSREISGKEATSLHSVLRDFPVHARNSQIRLSKDLSSPVQVGFLQSLILLPYDFLAASTEQQTRAVLLHEFAHWQRRDNLANLLQKVVAALYWWHPFVVRLDRVITRSREEVCDNYVLKEIDPVAYGETLLRVNTLLSGSCKPSVSNHAVLAAGIVDESWSLQDRIGELIDSKRERSMKLTTSNIGSIVFSVTCLTMILAAFSITPLTEPVLAQSVQDNTNPDPRPVPQARTAMTLSPQVFEAIQQVQELLSPEDDSVEPDPEAAKTALDALYNSVFDSANDFEKSTILNFYTNYYLMQRDYPGAIERFEALLQIANLREDQKLRTLRSLGQLYGQQERWQQAIESFEAWLEEGGEMDGVAARALSYAHYNLESWQQARNYWQRYLGEFTDDEPERDDLAYLNGLHYQLEDYEAALELTRQMILQFNDQTDWDNLRVLQRELEQMDSLADLDPDLGGTLDPGSSEPEIAFATVIPTDGDYLPLVAVAPLYPRRAADDGIEGWVLLEFTVTPQGDVDENSISVVDAEPADVFDRASIRAISDFVFSPRMRNGEAVAVSGVQYLFRFQLEDEDA